MYVTLLTNLKDVIQLLILHVHLRLLVSIMFDRLDCVLRCICNISAI